MDIAELADSIAKGVQELAEENERLCARIKALEEELLNALLEAEKNKLRRRAWRRENG